MTRRRSSRWPLGQAAVVLQDPGKDLYPNRRITKQDREREADTHLEYRLPRTLDPTDRDTKHRLLHNAKLRVRAKLLLATALSQQPPLDEQTRLAFINMQEQLANAKYLCLSYRQMAWLMSELVHIPCSVATCGKPSHYLLGIDSYCPGHRMEYQSAKAHFDHRWINHDAGPASYAAALQDIDRLRTQRDSLRRAKRKGRP